MFVRNGVRLALCAMTAATLGACAGTLQNPVGRGSVGVSFMMSAPPAERVEVISVSPSREHVWVKGHYIRSGNDYLWVEGRWERPAAQYHTWVPGHWDHESRCWFYVEGRWVS